MGRLITNENHRYYDVASATVCVATPLNPLRQKYKFNFRNVFLHTVALHIVPCVDLKALLALQSDQKDLNQLTSQTATAS